MHYAALFPNANIKELEQVLSAKKDWLSQAKKGFLRYQKPLEKIKHIQAQYTDFSKDTVTLGRKEELTDEDRERVYTCLRALMPWRKGPFSVFDIEIDAEWRSERKWNRLAPHLPDLKQKLVADIGCSNGYYMFRLAQYDPEFVLGFEPYIHHYYAFQTLNSLAMQKNLHAEPLGIEHLPLFPDSFDIILCLGILYHRHSPITALKDIYNALHSGGTVLIESQAIPGEEPFALFPESTYAKVPGTWFVPTASCLENWLKRVGFNLVTCFCQHPMNSEEQRKTPWMTFESYEDFIDKNNPALTIEGYPAPIRVFFKAVK
ncbi:MAG: tRNA 5-methoxyuridine(34)/uridine 5-oxyacetic acid(34) synthase CmoB [Desulfobulbus propionicus]|nr:MAG: tRNA 5-methoxyuridine(34)/uridine 5-oxyacetic acid(34) synthase CmoB [Desulfobulbus propionicus]